MIFNVSLGDTRVWLESGFEAVGLGVDSTFKSQC